MEKLNLADVSFQTEQVAEVNGAIGTMNVTLVPKLQAVSADTSSGISKLGPASLDFVETAFSGMESHEIFRDPFVSMDLVRTDMTSYRLIKGWKTDLKILYDLSEDTLMLIGSDLYKAALLFYKRVKEGVEQQVPGAQALYDQLKPRFEKAAKEVPPESVEHT